MDVKDETKFLEKEKNKRLIWIFLFILLIVAGPWLFCCGGCSTLTAIMETGEEEYAD